MLHPRPCPLALLVLPLTLILGACSQKSPDPGVRVVRVGHFPNITHAHGLLAHGTTREQRGWFEQRLGPGTKIEWFTYNAGPSAMEALLSHAIDLTYVGPSPALNAYVKSRGDEVRVIAGATEGGSALVVQGDDRIRSPEDFRGKRVATPQLGNTQDVACRAYLARHGFHVTQTGGDVEILPTQNPDQLSLFQRGDIDAVWTVEPWVSRLVTEANGKILLQEDDALTTVLVAGARFLREQPGLARAFLRAHVELTEWIRSHPEEAKEGVRAELAAETTREVKRDLVDRCWTRMHFTSEVKPSAFESFVAAAKQAGFLKDAGDLSRLVEVLP